MAQDDVTAASLIDMDFEELVQMDIQVESAGKTRRRALDLPYAVHVVTQDTIRDSGAQSIPDVLRLVPGVTVEQLSTAEWAIGIRGANGRYSRFVLVMIDGRIAYNSVFSGVNWDELNLILNDIERIEIIRGPNAAAWGANAVNGIINIITGAPEKKHGTQWQSWAGSSDRAGLSVVSRLPDIGDWALSGSAHLSQWQGLKYQTPGDIPREPDHDNWRTSLKAVRHTGRGNTQIFLDGFQSHLTTSWETVAPDLPQYIYSQNHEHKRGWSVLVNHRQDFSDTSYLQLRVGKDSILRDTGLYIWDSHNTQLDAEMNFQWGPHAISSGLNTRSTRSLAITDDVFSIRFLAGERTVDSIGFFVSDNVKLTDSLQMALSARVDKSDLSQQNIQPSVRFLWKAFKRSRIWAAYSEANTSPYRAMVDFDTSPYHIVSAAPPEQPLPVVVSLSRYPGTQKDTHLKSLEAGFRHRFNHFSVDLSLYHFDYENDTDIRVQGEPSLVFTQDYLPSHLELNAEFSNDRSYTTRGGELSINGHFSSDWSYQLAFSAYKRADSPFGTSYNLSGITSVGLTRNLRWNVAVRLLEENAANSWVNATLTNSATSNDSYDDSYGMLDTNIDWKISDRWSLAFIANNIGADHSEGVREIFNGDVLQVEPYALLRASFTF